MTKKIVKWWQQISFWNRLKGTIGVIGIGGEVALHFADSYPEWKIVAGIATVVALVIAQWFQDSDNDGTADIFQKPKTTV